MSTGTGPEARLGRKPRIVGGVTRSDQCEAFLLKARDYIL